MNRHAWAQTPKFLLNLSGSGKTYVRGLPQPQPTCQKASLSPFPPSARLSFAAVPTKSPATGRANRSCYPTLAVRVSAYQHRPAKICRHHLFIGASVRAVGTSCWCIVYPKGLMMEPEKRIKDSLLREAKRKLRASAHTRVHGLTPLFVQCVNQRRPAKIFGWQRRFVRFQDGTRKARKNTVIPCESIGAAATNRRWEILEP